MYMLTYDGFIRSLNRILLVLWMKITEFNPNGDFNDFFGWNNKFL